MPHRHHVRKNPDPKFTRETSSSHPRDTPLGVARDTSLGVARDTPLGVARDTSLDYLRGLAVLFMIITHVNAIFYTQTDTWLDLLTWWGATVSFTTFLFVSGAVTGITLKKGTTPTRRFFFLPLQILFVYFLMAVGVTFLTASAFTKQDLVDIITFQNIPLYTEFLIPFLAYPIITGIFRKPAAALAHRPILLTFLIATIYGAAMVLNKVDWGSGMMLTLKGILVGDGALHRFGILSYAPVYGLGILWGARKSFAAEMTQVAARKLFLVGLLLYIFLLATQLSTWERWPPSLMFLLYGFLFVFFIIWMYAKLKRQRLMHRAVLYLGTYSIELYCLHILVLLALSRTLVVPSQSEIASVWLFIVVMVISVGCVSFGTFVKKIRIKRIP